MYVQYKRTHKLSTSLVRERAYIISARTREYECQENGDNISRGAIKRKRLVGMIRVVHDSSVGGFVPDRDEGV